MSTIVLRSLLAVTLGLGACGGTEAPPAPTPDPPAEPALKADHGVDVDAKVIRIGFLNDESGPAAAIGKPFANGKRLLAARINAGASGLLPDGWKVELVERDHGYNPQGSVQAFNEIKGDVLFVGTSFGTPNTLPLRPHLEREKIVAFPASLSSQMAEHEFTPPLAASYEVEARRAMDWVVASAAGAPVKAGVVYQQDDYGKDGLDGWKAAAAHHGVEVVSEQTVAPGQKDFTAVVTGLKDAGATHVLLATLPSATGPIVGTAAQLKFAPVWIGNTPAWVDQFFNPEVVPSAVFASFHWVQSLPFWGEDVPGMDGFLQAWEAHGKEMGAPDSYVLMSYVAGLAQIEAARRAIDQGDVSRAGYLAAVHSLDGWDAGGMVQGITLTAAPYVVGTQTRVLAPDFEKKSWKVVADYAEPLSAPAPADADAEPDDEKAEKAEKTKTKTKAKSKTKTKSKTP